MNNFLTGHFYEIQGLLYMILAKQLDDKFWRDLFFWYGVIGILVGLVIQYKNRGLVL